MIMQGDGNLVLYNATGQPLWNAGTGGNSGAWAVMQSDGNFVVYSASKAPLWNAGTGATRVPTWHSKTTATWSFIRVVAPGGLAVPYQEGERIHWAKYSPAIHLLVAYPANARTTQKSECTCRPMCT